MTSVHVVDTKAVVQRKHVETEARVQPIDPIPTFEVMDALVKEGFEIVATSETKGHQRHKQKNDAHFLTLEVPGRVRAIGGWKPVVEVINSPMHSGGLKFLMLVRNPVLSADMVVAATERTTAKGSDARPFTTERRSFASLGGSTVADIKQAVIKLIDETLPQIKDKLNAMKHVTLAQADRESFAKQALSLRWPSRRGRKPLSVEQVLAGAGKDHSLFATYTSIHNALFTPIEQKEGSKKVQDIRTRAGELLLSRNLWKLMQEVFPAKH